MNRINFKTPSGLKIRLNHRYFFCQLTKPDRFYTDEEIVNSDTMYNATANIESMFLIPKMLVQVFTLLALVFHINIPVFCVISVSLFLFGCVWRCSKQDFLLSTILLFFATLYKMIWGVVYIALIVLVFTLDDTYLIIPYIAIRFICFVIELLQNGLISNITQKKYGVPFNDTEICAFRVFHLLSESNLRLSDYISLYVSTVCENEETPTDEKVSVMEDEQLSSFDYADICELEAEELMNCQEELTDELKQQILEEIQSTEFITVHTLSSKNGYYKDVIERTEENAATIDKWLDKNTGCLYMTVIYRDSEAESVLVTKEFFDTLYKHLDI